jgi:hypothetical protein
MILGDCMDYVVTGLGVGLVLLLLYGLFLHTRIRKLSLEIDNLNTSVDGLDTKANQLNVWSFKIHKWLEDRKGRDS